MARARALALHGQGVFPAGSAGRPIDSTRSAIRHLGYIQIDTISVVERAHHHVLWSRNRRYRLSHLDTLQAQGKIFEYWAHAASYLPMEDYRMYLPDMERIRAQGGLWHQADPALKRQILDRIRHEGPLRSRDFEDPAGGKRLMWQWKPAKAALETLFREGEVMIVRRDGFQKVYDLRERALPDWVDTAFPGTEEQTDFLIGRYLDANGFGTASEIAYLRAGVRPRVQKRLRELEESGRLMRVQVGDRICHARVDVLEHPGRFRPSSRVRILSPFDNLVIQRKRILALFGFDYQIECYTAREKRKYGYFCLPVLWKDRLVARLDCKAERDGQVLVIRNFVAEPGMRFPQRFLNALTTELSAFMRFNRCDRLRLDCRPGRDIEAALGGGIGESEHNALPPDRPDG